MWGDPERAIRLEPSDVLATVLFQISGPAHIPFQDPRWQELLYGYNVWVHVELANPDDEDASDSSNSRASSSSSSYDCLGRACQSMVRYAPHTGNLAALCLHTTRMLREVIDGPPPIAINHNDDDDGPAGTGTGTGTGTSTSTSTSGGQVVLGAVEAFSNRIAMVGRARALAGALNLLRILCHAVIVQDAAKRRTNHHHDHESQERQRQPAKRTSKDAEEDESTSSYLSQVFLYRSRDSGREVQAGADLLSALLQFCSSCAVGGADGATTTLSSAGLESPPPPPLPPNATQQQAASSTNKSLLSTIPELYDAAVLSIELLIVLYSQQLYNPMYSSFQRQQEEQQQQQQQHEEQFFAKRLFELAKKQLEEQQTNKTWTPQSVVLACLEWQLDRPCAPAKSIAHYNSELAKSVARAKAGQLGATGGVVGVGPAAAAAKRDTGELGPDGMYEGYQIVSACAPQLGSNGGAISNSSTLNQLDGSGNKQLSGGGRIILDATKGVLVLSSNIILLPFRLVSLALGLWGHPKEKGYDQAHKKHYQSTLQGDNNNKDHAGRRRKRQKVLTKDVLWLSDSPLADLASCLLLLLTNNERASSSDHDGKGEQKEHDDDHSSSKTTNPFRAQLWALTDTRWWEADANYNNSYSSDFPDLPDLTTKLESTPLMTSPTTEVGSESKSPPTDVVTVNFESLFESFGRIAHTEVGALLLYTLLQSSPAFADAMAVRSDLDTLILPLLRTLYFASSTRHYVAQDYSNYYSRSSAASELSTTFNSILSIRNCPFRSTAQLYVIIILLLLFSQDSSFGNDAFRRVMIPTVPFYKERNLKEISLGSILILSLLRNLAFNLNRLQDAFLLSNSCAILMNLSSTIVNLHDYAAMRLASVTISTMKRYVSLRQENAAAGLEVDENEDDLSSPTAMHGEVARTLLRVLKQCLGPRNIEGNLHLVYALVYHQADFKRAVGAAGPQGSPFKKSEINRVQKVIQAATSIIEQADTRTATRALKVLSENAEKMKQAVADNRKQRSDLEDFTFSYEEEVDPEIFFVPYVWEVIVCAVTASSIEWKKSAIQVFPLLQIEDGDEEEDEPPPGAQSLTSGDGTADLSETAVHGFAKDVSDVV